MVHSDPASPPQAGSRLPGSSSNLPGDLDKLVNVPVTQCLYWVPGNNTVAKCVIRHFVRSQV